MAVRTRDLIIDQSCQKLILASCLGLVRLDTCHSAYCVYVEHTDASQGEDWYMRIDGNGLLVRTLPLLRGKNNELGISTGICAMVRTIFFTNGTAGAEKGEHLLHSCTQQCTVQFELKE